VAGREPTFSSSGSSTFSLSESGAASRRRLCRALHFLLVSCLFCVSSVVCFALTKIKGMVMEQGHVRLKDALRDRHWQTYATFCREYDRAAEGVDSHLVGSWPSRAQLHRWLAGDLKGIPYPDHCRVLERMLPGWSIGQLFTRCGPECEQGTSTGPQISSTGDLVEIIHRGLATDRSTTREGKVRDRRSSGADLTSPTAELIARRLQIIGQIHRIPPDEMVRLASLSGNIVDLSVNIEINISCDGSCAVTYRYHELNLTSRKFRRASRGMWFQHNREKVTLEALQDGDREVSLQRLHSADNMVKFACLLSPSVEPGESVNFGYTGLGGEFRDDCYWRQSFVRHTRRSTLQVRHRGMSGLASLSAVREFSDGTEADVRSSAIWDRDRGDVVMIFTLDHLQPGQSATLRWEGA
jgi:hypothetical protein